MNFMTKINIFLSSNYCRPLIRIETAHFKCPAVVIVDTV